MEVRPGYKQTDVGVIPEEWEVHAFGELAHIERGKFTARPRNDPKYYGGDIPFIQTGDVTNANGDIRTYSQTLNLEGLKVSKLFPQGTLFFTIAANIGDVGFAAFDSACPDSLVAITPANKTDKTWLSYELARRKACFESIATHNAQLNINLQKLRPYLLPLPPRPEQHAIAAALSDVDALLKGLTRLIAKKRDLKQAAMQQLLTGQTRLPGFRGEWEQSTVGREFEVALGKMLDSEKNVGTPKPYIGNKSVQWGRIETTELQSVRLTPSDMQRYRLAEDDLLVCEGGEVGRAAIWKSPIEECYYQKALHRLRPLRGMNPHFMVAMLELWAKRGVLENYVTQTSIAHLPREKFIEVPIPVPAIHEQTAIAAALSDIDAEIQALEARRTKTRALKQAMMQELLTGRTRLV
jgi:type I restriction enzyme, S subunit